MGVYGNIGAFNGLGKPSIKLEFEDNESLVAFSKKMQDEEPAPVQWNEEEGMFTPVEGVRLSEKDFFDALEYNAEPYVYRDFNEQNIISVFGQPKHRKDSFGNVKYAFEINTPLKGSESKVYIWKDMNHALFDNSTKEDRSRFWTMIKPTIERPAIVFEKDGKNHFVKCFKTSDGQKVHFTFIPALVNEKNVKTFIVRGKRTQDEIYKIYNGKKGGGSVLKYLVGSNATINGADWLSEPILFVECRLYADKDNSNISDHQTFSEKKSLGAPGDTYIITDTRTRARKELEDTAALKKYDIRKFSGEELRRMQTDDPLLYEQIKSDINTPGLGKTANNALYNNLDILDYRGMQPTYRQLPNYDAFFKPATNRNSLKGFGLADTKKLIADICRNHYKECAAIARHLKAETKLQSAFNLWHWLHHNIRYEYDREGCEEVRTPARVWADRHRGVDCDCLSVLAWCVLKCMGYDPAFELAAFRNKPAYSHIYINLDGIVIDRVWYVFNSRPPFITKTELFKVRMLDNLGQLF